MNDKQLYLVSRVDCWGNFSDEPEYVVIPLSKELLEDFQRKQAIVNAIPDIQNGTWRANNLATLITMPPYEEEGANFVAMRDLLYKVDEEEWVVTDMVLTRGALWDLGCIFERHVDIELVKFTSGDPGWFCFQFFLKNNPGTIESDTFFASYILSEWFKEKTNV